MKTIVIQSSPVSKPEWISSCLQSVQDWAFSRGYEYRHLDDAEFFSAVPPAILPRLKEMSDRAPESDVARIEHASRLLVRGYGRVIWFDSDVFVFDPTLSLPEGTAFCREIWDHGKFLGMFNLHQRVNNAVMSLTSSPHFYIYRQRIMARAKDTSIGLSRCSLGPDLLDRIAQNHRLTLIDSIPTLGPAVLRSFIQKGELAKKVLSYHGVAPKAFHLCASGTADPADYEAVIRGARVKVSPRKTSDRFGKTITVGGMIHETARGLYRQLLKT